MGKFKEYSSFDGIGLAELIRRKEVSNKEVLEESIQRIEEKNPELNAVVTPLYDFAEKSLTTITENNPFSGVPFLLKDLLASLKGTPMTNGSKAFSGKISNEDSELVRRYKQSGVMILGKTNCPEFGLMGITEPDLHGPTRNPWNTEHTPGGSSGGSAAAVASGMVPIASAGDGGGSIRIPASCCALFGLKPSRGRVPTGPDYGEIWQGAVVEHILSKSVRDSAAMLDCISGADIGAPYAIKEPEETYLETISQAPKTLKIAFDLTSPAGTAVDDECKEAVYQTAKVLEKLGHHVEEASPSVDGKAVLRSYLMMYFGEMAADMQQIPELIGRKLKPSDLEITTRLLGLLGRTYSAGDFVLELRQWGKAARQMGEFHETYDLLLTPTTATPPVKVGELKPKPAEKLVFGLINSLRLGKIVKATGMVDKIATESFSKTPFTQLANITGQPAMSVPMHWTKDNLPCGVQFIAPFGDESTLLKLAAQLEAECPWIDRYPAA